MSGGCHADAVAHQQGLLQGVGYKNGGNGKLARQALEHDHAAALPAHVAVGIEQRLDVQFGSFDQRVDPRVARLVGRDEFVGQVEQIDHLDENDVECIRFMATGL